MILRYYNSKYYIYIKTDFLRYTIDRIFCQMILDQYFSDFITYKTNNPANLINSLSEIDQLYLITYFFGKMITIKTWYETYNQELLIIIKAFKT